MIWLRLLIVVIALIAALYYTMVLLQCFNVISFTKRNITFIRMLIPFYYWIAPLNEKKPTK